jgi:hypothetical protein
MMVGAVCTFEGCGKNAVAKGKCWGHYAQQRRGTPLHPLGRFRGGPPAGRRTPPECSFEGCHRPNRGKELCDGHRRQRDRRKPLRPLGPPRGRPRRVALERGDALRVP